VFGWAACLVDVAVDLDTYEVTIERCVQAVDVVQHYGYEPTARRRLVNPGARLYQPAPHGPGHRPTSARVAVLVRPAGSPAP